MIRAAAMAHFHRNTYRVAKFIDPVRGVKASFKVGLKGGMSHTPLKPHFKAGFNSRTGSMNRLLLDVRFQAKRFWRENSTGKTSET
jgi:hypothetical protein